MHTIRFYKTSDPYGFLSNFSRHSFFIGEYLYKTSEHYFQSMKFAERNPEYAEKIRLAKTPGDAARLGRDKTIDGYDPYWPVNRHIVMMNALYCKFTQNRDIGIQLVNTGDAWLVEYSSNDKYWGQTDTGGENMLGYCLMAIRLKLKHHFI